MCVPGPELDGAGMAVRELLGHLDDLGSRGRGLPCHVWEQGPMEIELLDGTGRRCTITPLGVPHLENAERPVHLVWVHGSALRGLTQAGLWTQLALGMLPSDDTGPDCPDDNDHGYALSAAANEGPESDGDGRASEHPQGQPPAAPAAAPGVLGAGRLDPLASAETESEPVSAVAQLQVEAEDAAHAWECNSPLSKTSKNLAIMTELGAIPPHALQHPAREQMEHEEVALEHIHAEYNAMTAKLTRVEQAAAKAARGKGRK
eukprot:jgi/Tetstr1/421833/TSEL_012734.t1